MITFEPIGVLHTPHHEQQGTPIQPTFAEDYEGEAVIVPELAAGLQDLEGFERIWLIYCFHRVERRELRVVPFRDTQERGVFATRSPLRPNHIGISAVRLLAIAGERLRFRGADMLDGSPLLDIKPYAPLFDAFPDSRQGWLGASQEQRTRADERFAEPRG